MAFSDNENDYFSDTYNDDISTKDQIINDLKKLSNKNDIKAIRQYIIINKNKLKDYTARLLNEVVNVKGYKFMRREGKLIITKISPSSRYYKPDNIKAAKSEYTPTNTDFESVASYADLEGFSEATPALSNSRNENIKEVGANNNIQPKQSIKSYQETERIPKHLNEPSKVDLLEANNNDKAITINSVLLPQNSKQEAKAEITNLNNNSELTNSNNAPELTNLKYSPELESLLNSIYKQANEQNENQRTQYERLTKTLNDSIQAKDKAEQERINKFNKCVETIEKTFSAGTFDRIIEHIDNMVSKFVNSQDAKNTEFNNKFEFIDNDISELLKTTKQQQEVINEISIHNNFDNLEDNETINDLNITIDELTEKIQEQEDTIKKLKEGCDKLIKQHADLINKLMLSVYNINESIFEQVFNKQAQEGNAKDSQRIDNENEDVQNEANL